MRRIVERRSNPQRSSIYAPWRLLCSTRNDIRKRLSPAAVLANQYECLLSRTLGTESGVIQFDEVFGADGINLDPLQ